MKQGEGHTENWKPLQNEKADGQVVKCIVFPGACNRQNPEEQARIAAGSSAVFGAGEEGKVGVTAQSIRNGWTDSLADTTVMLYGPNDPYDHLHMFLEHPVDV